MFVFVIFRFSALDKTSSKSIEFVSSFSFQIEFVLVTLELSFIAPIIRFNVTFFIVELRQSNCVKISKQRVKFVENFSFFSFFSFFIFSYVIKNVSTLIQRRLRESSRRKVSALNYKNLSNRFGGETNKNWKCRCFVVSKWKRIEFLSNVTFIFFWKRDFSKKKKTFKSVLRCCATLRSNLIKRENCFSSSNWKYVDDEQRQCHRHCKLKNKTKNDFH